MKLLSAAGLADGFTTTIRTSDGFTPAWRPISILVQEDMEALGINIERLPPNGEAFSRQYYSQSFSDPEVRDAHMLYGWSTASPTANDYFWENIHSQSASQHFNIIDATVDDLADRQFVELDPDARREMHVQIVDYFSEEAFWLDKVPGLGRRLPRAPGAPLLAVQRTLHRDPLVLGLGLRLPQGLAGPRPSGGVAHDRPPQVAHRSPDSRTAGQAGCSRRLWNLKAGAG